MSRLTGAVPVNGALIPVLVTFADPANPGTARMVSADDAAAALGEGYRLRASPLRWCRTDTGRSISAARWASPSPAGSLRNCPG